MPVAPQFGMGVAVGRGGSLGQQGFSPAALFGATDVGAWYDPSDLNTLRQLSGGTGAVAVGDPVGYMADLSGRGNHAIQATAAARPILRQESGRYYLEFDGVDDFIRSTFSIAVPWDRISAMRQISWTSNDEVYAPTPGASANAFLRQQGATSDLAMWGGSGAIITIPGATVGTNNVITERHNGASSRGAVNNAAYVTGTLAAANPNGITIGASSGGTANSNIRLYGVLMIGRTLTDVEIGFLRRYMGSKSGLTL